MSGQTKANEIKKQAQYLLESGQFGGSTVRKSGQIAQPIPVLDPNRQPHSWFVPVIIGSQLAAFFEFQPDGTLIRFSSFQRREESLDGCPTAESWIDTESIQRRLHNDFPDQEVKELFLSYDRSPSRLAWRAQLESSGGRAERTFYVAGPIVWESTPPAADENSFGGR